jgi:hypothetical protein
MDIVNKVMVMAAAKRNKTDDNDILPIATPEEEVSLLEEIQQQGDAQRQPITEEEEPQDREDQQKQD